MELIWFYRERWGEDFLTVPKLPRNKVEEVLAKFEQEIKMESTAWGEIEFLYDGNRIYPWTEEEEIKKNLSCSTF